MLLFIVLFYSVLGYGIPTPNISRHFSVTLHVDIKILLTHYILNGKLVVDADANGMYASLYGDNPKDWWHKLNTTVVVHPNTNNSVSVWSVIDNKCSYYESLESSKIPPLSVPSNASYLGKRVVRNLSCDVWQVANPYKDVKYCNVLVNGTDIQLIEAMYTGGAANAYMYIDMHDHDNSIPSLSVFDVPVGC